MICYELRFAGRDGSRACVCGLNWDDGPLDKVSSVLSRMETDKFSKPISTRVAPSARGSHCHCRSRSLFTEFWFPLFTEFWFLSHQAFRLPSQCRGRS
jgi:hypothetical protein